jgi:hypothetical protein
MSAYYQSIMEQNDLQLQHSRWLTSGENESFALPLNGSFVFDHIFFQTVRFIRLPCILVHSSLMSVVCIQWNQLID